MKRRIVGALLLLLLGIVAIGAAWYFLPRYRDMKQKSSSDALRTKGKIRIALDNWIGYSILRSPEMKQQMRRTGWMLVCEDDKANYRLRMERLKDGDIDFAVATVDSYILNGAAVGFPGVVIMVIDESKGGDAILARGDALLSLDALKGRTDLRVAFTPNSPSEYLAKAAAYHFDVPELVPPPGDKRIETEGSEDALKKLLAGRCDLAALWEPDVSRALSSPGIQKIIGTEDTEKLIVDILLVNREFSRERPDVVEAFLLAYFRALKEYRSNPDLLREQVRQETGLSEDAIGPMLKGVQWVNLTANCEKWFGIAAPGSSSDEGLIRTIDSTVHVLMNAGDFRDNPLPDQDPFRLIYSAYLENLFVKAATGFTKRGPASVHGQMTASPPTRFPPLDEAGWGSLAEVGTLKLDPVTFQHGSSELDLLGKEVIDKAAKLLAHYPNFRLLVKGHTGTRGDPTENQRLSRERADSIARYLEITHDIDRNRMRPLGLGADQPLPRESGESFRTWQYRLPRVELVLVREEY